MLCSFAHAWARSVLHKSFNKIKAKKGRDLLLEKALQGGSQCVEAVDSLRDAKVTEAFTSNAKAILRGHCTKERYNLCVGLIAARLIYR
jgi:hypothetical protein